MRRFAAGALTALAPYDAVLTPTLAGPPLPVGAMRDDADPPADFEAQKAFTPWTSAWNVTGMPAVSLPLHWTAGRAAGRRDARRPPRRGGAAARALRAGRGGRAVVRPAAAGMVSVRHTAQLSADGPAEREGLSARRLVDRGADDAAGPGRPAVLDALDGNCLVAGLLHERRPSPAGRAEPWPGTAMSPRTPSWDEQVPSRASRRRTPRRSDRSPARPAGRISSACWRLTSIRLCPKACSRSIGGSPWSRAAAGPSMTNRWNSVSDRLSSAAIRPSRLSKRRNTVPLPTPASVATLSMVTASTPQCSPAGPPRPAAPRGCAPRRRAPGRLVEERERVGTRAQQ